MGVEQKDNKRTHKCPGSKIPDNSHSFSTPGPHCQGTKGLPSTERSNVPSLSKLPGVQNGEKAADQKADKVQDVYVGDEQVELQQKLKHFHMAENALQKKKQVKMLKQAIVEAEQRLANLTASPPSSS